MPDTIPSYKYCFSEAEKAIRYTDNQLHWTPNNLRRLFISPDGVIAQFHVGVKPRKRVFAADKYASCVSDMKYVTMTNALGGRAGTSICSHVEEVVYCLKGTNGGVLRQEEADWRSIISMNKASNSPDALKKSIGERFRRLRAFVIFDGTLQELMQVVGQHLGSPVYQIADDTNVSTNSRVSVIDIHKHDWYMGHYFRPNIYPSDAENGSLYNRLKFVEEKMASKSVEEKKQSSKDANLKGYENKFSEAYKRFMEVFTSYKKVAIKMLRANDKSFLSAKYFGEFDLQHMSVKQGSLISDYFEMIPDSVSEDLGRLGVRVSRSKEEATVESVKESIQLLNNLSIFYYQSFVSNYLNFFIKLKESGKFDMFVERFFKPAILIPSGAYLDGLNVSVLSMGRDDFGSGKSISRSIEVMTDSLFGIGLR